MLLLLFMLLERLEKMFRANRKLYYKLSSPDHQSVRNKEVKFICICSPGPRFSVRCPYYRFF